MSLVGNTNELNGAYAADGYARVNGIGALITTHGVGELSATNGIAGAASERIPVIHVVGQTARKFQEKQLMIHHSIGTKPDHQLFNKVSKHIRADAAELWEGDKAPAEIDRVIRECVIQSAPVYIFIPLDLHDHQVSASLLDEKIDLTFPVNHANEKAAIEAITQALSQAKKPVIFLDMLAQRFATKEVKQLVDTAALPFFASHGSKGLVDEDHDRFVGLYNGPASEPGIVDAIEGSDQVLAVGWWPADTNGGLFRKIPEDKRIDIMDDHVIVSCLSSLSKTFVLICAGEWEEIRAGLHGFSPPKARRSSAKSEHSESSDATIAANAEWSPPERCDGQDGGPQSYVAKIGQIHPAS